VSRVLVKSVFGTLFGYAGGGSGNKKQRWRVEWTEIARREERLSNGKEAEKGAGSWEEEMK